MTCPACHGRLASLLGRLGYLVWFRCVACGIDYSVNVDALDVDTLDAINAECEDRQ